MLLLMTFRIQFGRIAADLSSLFVKAFQNVEDTFLYLLFIIVKEMNRLSNKIIANAGKILTFT
jgi:hypothetical protein